MLTKLKRMLANFYTCFRLGHEFGLMVEAYSALDDIDRGPYYMCNRCGARKYVRDYF